MEDFEPIETVTRSVMLQYEAMRKLGACNMLAYNITSEVYNFMLSCLTSPQIRQVSDMNKAHFDQYYATPEWLAWQGEIDTAPEPLTADEAELLDYFDTVHDASHRGNGG